MVDLLLDGDGAATRSAPIAHRVTTREPTRAMGFCLFNNVALAARYALDARGLERVMIVDWDVHHGNGTNDIFHDTDRVLFVSIHQSPLYPGHGPGVATSGRGDGRGFTVNLPVPAGLGRRGFLLARRPRRRAAGAVVRARARAVSAGYDAHREDPLAVMRGDRRGVRRDDWRRSDACAKTLGIPVGCVLEGGYALGALARSVAATLAALNGPAAAPGPDVGEEAAPAVARARERIAQWWPALR